MEIIPQSKNPRTIKYIILHCTAGPQTQTVEEIQAYWRRPVSKGGHGWKSPGYHFMIRPDGSYAQLAALDKICNGVAGYNSNAIHISYIGGVDSKGKAVDNRTEHQIRTQIELVTELKSAYPNAVILGHRDFSTDKNGNGIIEQWEWIKNCPAFDVRDWLQSEGLANFAKPSKIVYKLNYPLIKDKNVVTIQKALEKHGFKFPMYGNFGEMTDKAVREFQKSASLPDTGIVDDATCRALGIVLK